MGFNQIKKMFEMYVDSKLNLKPIPNYFDRILLGKIVDSYKALNAVKPKKVEEKEMSDQEKDFIMLEAVDRIKREVKHNGTITSMCAHVYDYLDGQGKLPTDKEYKLEVFERAKAIAKGDAATKSKYSLDDHRKLQKTIKDISDGKHSAVIDISKRLVLEEYFKTK
jgi:hypothetical protein